jgi:hypothetical protein
MTNGAGVERKKHSIRTYALNQLRDWDRKAGKYDRTRRLQALLGGIDGRDWGHKLMALTGRNFGGNWNPPHAPDLYLRFGPERGENRHVLSIEKPSGKPFITTHGMTAWDGVKRGEEWRTFDWQDDGHTLRVGWLSEDGYIHDSGIGAYSGELTLFRKWFIWDSWIKSDWFGLRRWLYYKGLHAAVHQKKPFTCQKVPPRNSGGYDHWHCIEPIGYSGTLRRWLDLPYEHPMPHRYARMEWTDSGQVRHIPTSQELHGS